LFFQCDLASIESIKKFVEDFTATEKKLHVLVNNAGVALPPKDIKRQFTADNFEITMGNNHLGRLLVR
jgi:NAD(P)-dependent dehydrogenase (short-subunit alcohol dehydrogenase family)